MANLVQDNEDYDYNYDVLQNLNPPLVKPYLDILFMDALVFNVDRHTQNYGRYAVARRAKFSRWRRTLIITWR